MNSRTLRPLLLVLTALIYLVTFQQTVLAGPPLLCFPFDIGNDKSLPWGGSTWRASKADYDINRLVDDTLALLSAETTIITRMETMRRATIYAANDKQIATQLYSRLMDRTKNAKGKALALALFDAGYLVETYKQAIHLNPNLNFIQTIDGYALVIRAIESHNGSPEMEFAAALISVHPKRSGHNEHIQKATAGAAEGSLLARNLASHLNHWKK
ncbi:MAG: hypothetical protein AB1489_34780 [Acidobacteriota bacterium]